MSNRAQAKLDFSDPQMHRPAGGFLIGLGIWLLAGLTSCVAMFDQSLVLRPTLNLVLWSVFLLLGWWVAWRSPYRQLIPLAYPSSKMVNVFRLMTVLLVAALSWANGYLLVSMAHTAIGKEERTNWTVSAKSLSSAYRMAWTACPYRIHFKESARYPGGQQCVSRAEFDAVQIGALWEIRVLRSPLGESRMSVL